MGKGDKRTKKGKIFAGSFGKTRPKSTRKKAYVAPAAGETKAPKKKKKA